MLAPDSVDNIRRVLDEDRHALPVWAIRALRLLLDEREHLIGGLIGDAASDEIAKIRRRLVLAHALIDEWDRQQTRFAHEYEGASYELGVARGMRACIDDLRAVLVGGV